MPRVDVPALLERHGMSAQRLADHLGVHVRTVRRWNAREVDPSPLALKQLRDLDRQQQQDADDSDSTATRVRRATGLIPSAG